MIRLLRLLPSLVVGFFRSRRDLIVETLAPGSQLTGLPERSGDHAIRLELTLSRRRI
jgi:hypothetical protein